MAVQYEWDVEEVIASETEDYEEGEVIEHWFQPCFADCLRQLTQVPAKNCRWAIVLVCDDDLGRSWAYLDMGTRQLPVDFRDAFGRFARAIPKRYREEVEKANKKAI